MGGRLEVHVGPMFAGKTTALITALERYRTSQVFIPTTDDRYSADRIVTHDGRSLPATPVSPDAPHHIPAAVAVTTPDAVGIDEAQFFDEELVDAVTTLTAAGHDVVVAGLDTDFRGEGFGPVPQLRSMADREHMLLAPCARCGGDAAYTQRLIDGEPAPSDAPVIDVGGSERYEARCRRHHVVPQN